MFINFISSENHGPKGALEIELEVRSRERQRVLEQALEEVGQSRPFTSTANPLKMLFNYLFASPRSSTRQLATVTRK